MGSVYVRNETGKFMRKVFVDVIVKYTKDGRLIPLEFMWEDGRKFDVDKIIDVCRAASLKAGGQGIRYKCMIAGKEAYMFLEDDKWFMEGK